MRSEKANLAPCTKSQRMARGHEATRLETRGRHRRRSGRAVSACARSELGGIRVRAEHSAEHVADLLLRAIRLRGEDDRRHQVRSAARRRAHRLERTRYLRRVPFAL